MQKLTIHHSLKVIVCLPIALKVMQEPGHPTLQFLGQCQIPIEYGNPVKDTHVFRPLK